MSFSEQIKYGFYRIESFYRNFNKKCVPIRHRAVPESRQFKGFELAALIALGADQTGLLVYIFKEVKFLVVVVFETAHKVYRIEVSCTLELLLSVWIGWVNLRSFKDLE